MFEFNALLLASGLIFTTYIALVKNNESSTARNVLHVIYSAATLILVFWWFDVLNDTLAVVIISLACIGSVFYVCKLDAMVKLGYVFMLSVIISNYFLLLFDVYIALLSLVIVWIYYFIFNYFYEKFKN